MEAGVLGLESWGSSVKMEWFSPAAVVLISCDGINGIPSALHELVHFVLLCLTQAGRVF